MTQLFIRINTSNKCFESIKTISQRFRCFEISTIADKVYKTVLCLVLGF